MRFLLSSVITGSLLLSSLACEEQNPGQSPQKQAVQEQSSQEKAPAVPRRPRSSSTTSIQKTARSRAWKSQ